MTEPKRLSGLEELRPDVRDLARRWREAMAVRGSPVVILETRRTPERQDWLYAQGRTRPGSIVTHLRGSDTAARHVAPPGLATALDFAFPGSAPFAAHHPWQVAGELAEGLGFVWGGRWKMRDLGHLQYDRPVATLPPMELARGAEGVDVRAIQHAIVRLYDATGARFPALALELDGRFGPATDRAVRALQGLYGHEVSGLVTPALRAALGIS